MLHCASGSTSVVAVVAGAVAGGSSIVPVSRAALETARPVPGSSLPEVPSCQAAMTRTVTATMPASATSTAFDSSLALPAFRRGLDDGTGSADSANRALYSST